MQKGFSSQVLSPKQGCKVDHGRALLNRTAFPDSAPPFSLTMSWELGRKGIMKLTMKRLKTRALSRYLKIKTK